MLEIENMSAGYLSETILRGFSLSVKRGEIVGIFGPNGAGKTTLLCAVNGLARVTKGSVRVGGVEFRRGTASGLRKRIGYVPQHFETDPMTPASAKDVILMGACGIRGILRPAGASEANRMKELSACLGLTALLGKPFGQLSGGEKQKTLIARALIQKPEVLLLDEIFAWIDSGMQKNILELIVKLHHQQNLTTLIVSHNAAFIKNSLTRIVYLEKARIVFDGKPGDCELPLCCAN